MKKLIVVEGFFFARVALFESSCHFVLSCLLFYFISRMASISSPHPFSNFSSFKGVLPPFSFESFILTIFMFSLLILGLIPLWILEWFFILIARLILYVPHRSKWGPLQRPLFQMWVVIFGTWHGVSPKALLSIFHALLAGGTHGASITPLVCSSPLATWAWVLTLDPLDAFHLGFHHPHLYLHILFALWQEVQLAFRLPFNCFVWDLFNVPT